VSFVDANKSLMVVKVDYLILEDCDLTKIK